MCTRSPSTRPLRGRRQRQRLHLLARTAAFLARPLTRTPLGVLVRRRLRSQLEVRRSRVELPRVPVDLELPRVAFLSDLHAGFFSTPGDLEWLAARVAAEAPDLVLLGGDLIDAHGEEIWLLGPALRRLSPPLGIFAVPGNHEYFRPEALEDWIEFLEANGVGVLMNRGVRVEYRGTSLWLAGIDDWLEGRPDLYAALAGRKRGEPTLLLSHHPDAFVHSSREEVDLQLSGHTHGGQVRFRGYAPMRHTSFGFLDGLYTRDASQLYVGRGGGVTFLPVRCGAAPEVGILDLRGARRSVAPERFTPTARERLDSKGVPVRAPFARADAGGGRVRPPKGRSRRS